MLDTLLAMNGKAGLVSGQRMQSQSCSCSIGAIRSLYSERPLHILAEATSSDGRETTRELTEGFLALQEAKQDQLVSSKKESGKKCVDQQTMRQHNFWHQWCRESRRQGSANYCGFECHLRKAAKPQAERVRRYMMQQGEKLEEMDQGQEFSSLFSCQQSRAFFIRTCHQQGSHSQRILKSASLAFWCK